MDGILIILDSTPCLLEENKAIENLGHFCHLHFTRSNRMCKNRVYIHVSKLFPIAEQARQWYKEAQNEGRHLLGAPKLCGDPSECH